MSASTGEDEGDLHEGGSTQLNPLGSACLWLVSDLPFALSAISGSFSVHRTFCRSSLLLTGCSALPPRHCWVRTEGRGHRPLYSGSGSGAIWVSLEGGLLLDKEERRQ